MAFFFSNSLPVVIAVLILILYVASNVRSYWRLRHIPGPTLWAWSVIPLFMVHLKGDIYDKFGELNSKYGPLVRIAPNTLLTSDGDALRRMNAARSPYSRSDWYIATRMMPGKDNVISMRDEKLHEEKRRKMAAGYSGKENPTLEQDIDECVKDLVNLIDDKYIADRSNGFVKMDLARKIQFYTSDVMSKLSFDAKFHDLRDDNDNFGYIHEIETLFPNIFCLCTIPSVVKFFTDIGLLNMFAPSVNSKFGLGKVLSITSAQVSRRFDADGKPKLGDEDMLGSFIRHGLGQEEAVQESILQLLAGSDTTASGIRATLLCIISNHRVYNKLLMEIDEAVTSGKLTVDKTKIVPDKEARELPYLQACIKEGLRWYPAIVSMLSKKTPAEGDTVCGYAVPGGVSIGYSAKGTHHTPTLFGPDETVFRPERWITTQDGGDEPDTEKIKAMERNNDLIFGHGRYQCLGKNIAAIELNKVVFELVRRFEMALADPTKVWATKCFGIHVQTDMWVSVKKRQI